jgi:pimeloyl-ACP methyl ester carboxylesterase
MATFGLIHGSWHGGWCWAAFVPELERLGHEALTVDLPIDTDTGPRDWARVAAEAFAGDEPPIVVGHSMAGIVAPLVADLMAVRGIVYLSALIRRPGGSCADDRAAGLNIDLNVPGFAVDVVRDAEGYTAYPDAEAAARDFYQDCEPGAAAWAFPRLRRQRGYWRDASPQAALPPVPAASIVCTADRAINPAWQRRVARDWLGVTPIDFASGHSPFLSRPRALATLFDELAETVFAA